MICPECQTDAPDGFPFCPECGAPLSGAVCTRCQATAPLGARFCPECGLPFLAEEETLAADEAMGLPAPPTLPGTVATDSVASDSVATDSVATDSVAGAERADRDSPSPYATLPATPERSRPGVAPAALAERPTVVLAASAAYPRAMGPLLVLGLVGALVGVYALRVVALRGDWAQGAGAVSVAAGAMAVAAVLVALAWLWYMRTRPMGAHLAVIGALLVTAIAGVASETPLLRAQASAAAHEGHWAVAISEYQRLGGAQGDLDALGIYEQWLTRSPATVPYPQAIRFLAAARASAYCAASCRAAALNAEAQADYQYGLRLAAAHHDTAALTVLLDIARVAPASPYAHLAHLAAAADQLALALHAIGTGACVSGALPLYRILASQYGDTAQGRQAAQALASGVTVTGIITNLPEPASSTLYLSLHFTAPRTFSDDYHTQPESTGHFRFTDVASGAYNLSAVASGETTYWHDASGSLNPYTVVVGQLCAVNAGSFPY